MVECSQGPMGSRVPCADLFQERGANVSCSDLFFDPLKRNSPFPDGAKKLFHPQVAPSIVEAHPWLSWHVCVME